MTNLAIIIILLVVMDINEWKIIRAEDDLFQLSDLDNEIIANGDHHQILEQQPVPQSKSSSIAMTECHLRPVIHILQRAGCIPKPIPSFACYGTCNSYVQVSNSKFWQVERSCNCCQEIGEREASIMLHCPKQTPNFRKVTTRAPVECLCRPCTAVDEHQIRPLEMHQENIRRRRS